MKKLILGLAVALSVSACSSKVEMTPLDQCLNNVKTSKQVIKNYRFDLLGKSPRSGFSRVDFEVKGKKEIALSILYPAEKWADDYTNRTYKMVQFIKANINSITSYDELKNAKSYQEKIDIIFKPFEDNCRAKFNENN